MTFPFRFLSTACAATRNPRRAALTLASLAAALLSLLAVPARAQFNGPNPIPYGAPTGPAVLTSDTALLYPSPQDLVILPGDLITVFLYGDPEYHPVARLGTDGDVALPLIGSIHLQDLSVTQAEQLIAEKLVADGMYRNPQVILQVSDGTSSSVTLIGEMHGVIPVVGSRHLFDALSAGGGLPATASHVIAIQRRGLAEPIVVDLGTDPMRSQYANVTILPGDTIVTSRLGNVYVLGAFKSSGIVPLTSYAPLTLTELSALSGGAMYEAENSGLRIIRTDATGRRTVARFDLKRVVNGKDPDPILQPGDIVYLPVNPIRAVFTNGSFATVIGLISLAVSLRGY